jgi:hypothetical protein
VLFVKIVKQYFEAKKGAEILLSLWAAKKVPSLLLLTHTW